MAKKKEVKKEKKKENKGKKKKGFTLVEILAAITILGVITVVALPAIGNISEEMTLKKYESYKDALEAAGKLYMDKNQMDIFGSQENGCFDITYDMLEKEEKLIEKIDMKDVTCEDSRTIVRVHKKDNVYNYETYMTCKKGDEITYPKDGEAITPTGTCDGTIDTDGPTIKISPDGNATAAMKQSTKVYIEDVSGYGPNLSFDYYWEKEGGGEVGKGTYDYKNKAIMTSEPLASQRIDTPDGVNGKFRLVVIPKNIVDNVGNTTDSTVYSKYFLLDNEKPTANIQIESTKSEYHHNKVKVKITSADAISGVSQLCLTTVNSVSSCTWVNGTTLEKEHTFSTSSVGSGDTKTLYAYAKDKVGNVSIVAYQSYTIYKNCTSSTYIDCRPFKKSGGGDYNYDTTSCTAADGTGWGKKKRSCSNRDSVTGAYCSSVVRTCPCNSMCNADGKRTEEARPGCSYPFCDGHGIYCENNACREESFY